MLDRNVVKRVIAEARYIIENNANMRETAKVFNVSRQTVSVDMDARLQRIDADLHAEVKKVVQNNAQSKHYRGGYAPKNRKPRIRPLETEVVNHEISTETQPVQQ